MNLYYDLQKNIQDFHTILSVDDMEIVSEHEYIFKVAYNLISLICNTTDFMVRFKSNLFNYHFVITLKNRQTIEIDIDDKMATVIDSRLTGSKGGVIYKFKHYIERGTLVAKLKSISFENTSCQIEEIFSSHLITLKIILATRAYKMQIPFEPTRTIDPCILKTITFNSNISDLKSIYLDYFYICQTEYNRLLNTTLEISETFESGESFTESLTMKNGKISGYEYIKQIGETAIHVSGKIGDKATVVIKGLDLNANLNLNQEVKDILKKARTIGQSKIIKL